MTFQTPALPKWPAMTVRGEPITSAQAAEVIVRTTAIHYLSCNDREWNQIVNDTFGFEMANHGYPVSPCYREEEHDHTFTREDGTVVQSCSPVNRRIVEELGVLRLNYIENDRIASRYIGGPSGWCDWNGNIFQNSKNVGKWPSCEEIREDWKTVAAAFPFLDLTAWLFDEEAGEGDNPAPLVQYRVKGGKVRMTAPGKNVLMPGGLDIEGAVFRMVNNLRTERGTDRYGLAKAIEVTKASVAG